MGQYNLMDYEHSHMVLFPLSAQSDLKRYTAPSRNHSTGTGYSTVPILCPHTAPENVTDRWVHRPY